MNGKVALALVPRDEPLTPVGVVAFGEVARALAWHVLARFEDGLPLEGVAGDGALLLLGAEVVLPFVDGVIYLGTEEGAPSVLVPTTHRTTAPITLVDAFLRERGVDLPAALVVHESALEVVSVRDARKISRARLETFLRTGSP